MAEAIAKHFKEFLPNAPAVSAAAAAPAAPTPVPATVEPAVAPAPAPAPALTQAAYQRPADPAPATSQVLSQDNSLADAARKAKQHKACLELAKDNPSITCN